MLEQLDRPPRAAPGERREQPGLALEDVLGGERARFGELDRGHGVARGEARVEVHLAAAGMRPLVEPARRYWRRARAPGSRAPHRDRSAGRRDGGGERADQAGRAEQPGELRGHQRPSDPAAGLVARDRGRKTGSAADARARAARRAGSARPPRRDARCCRRACPRAPARGRGRRWRRRHRQWWCACALPMIAAPPCASSGATAMAWRLHGSSRASSAQDRKSIRQTLALASTSGGNAAWSSSSAARASLRASGGPLKGVLSLVMRRFPAQLLISTPAHSSTTLAIEVKSESGPNLALVTASIWRTTAPRTIGTPSASASSTHRRTSL